MFKSLLTSHRLLPILFFFSGFSALIYQISWQRVLFGIYGSNIESVSLIVAIFMLGLGIGSLVGGYFSKRPPSQLPKVILIIELLIAGFGFFSLSIIDFSGNFVMNQTSIIKTITIIFTLLPPTILMGMTLPVFIQYMRQYMNSDTETISDLYYLNTLGASFAALMTILFLFSAFGLQGSVQVAVLSNLIVGLLVYIYVKYKI